ncbi:MAG TPA: glycosyltransferase family 39 protein [Candidatus Binatia bacterium]
MSSARGTRVVVLVAVLAATCVLLPGLGHTPLVDWDEGIYAEVARGVREHDAWRLTWNGEAYNRKPPLLFWAIAASYEVFGVSEAAARLPSALAGVATVGVVAAVVATRSGPVAGLLAAALLLGSTLFLERGGRRACTDSLVILFSAIALWRATANPGTRRARIEAGVAIGLGILAKGAAGLIAPVALLLAAPLDRTRRADCAWMMAVATLVAAPWYAVQLWIGGTEFLASHVGFELIERALRPIHGDGAPWWYPLWVMRWNGGVWVPVVALAAVLRASVDAELRPGILPWLCFAALVVAASMSMQTKLPWYPLPALPMLAVAGGLAAARGAARSWTAVRSVALAGLGLVALHSLALTGTARRTVIDEELQFVPFRDLGARIALALGEEPFIGATRENPTLIFYGGRPIRIYQEEELSRLLRDPDSLPRAGLVPVAEADALLGGGAEEIARFGDRVLLRFAPVASVPPTAAQDVEAIDPAAEPAHDA